MVSQLKRRSQSNVPRHLVQPSDTGLLGGDKTVSNSTVRFRQRCLKIRNVQKSTIGILLDLKNLINCNRDEKTKLLTLSKVGLRSDCVVVYKDASQKAQETHNIPKSIQ